MADYKVMVVGQVLSADAARDWTTNVLHYSAATTGPSAIGAAILSAFGGTSRVQNTWWKTTVKVYDMSLPLHSPPVYTSSSNGLHTITPAPRQIALCLSFFSGLNVKGQRGRIYIGPWAVSDMSEYATTTEMSLLITLAGLIKNPGGADVIHNIYHPKTGTHSNVSNYFVNNRWDTMRSRLPKETARQTLP
jgi:hypothetical protein